MVWAIPGVERGGVGNGLGRTCIVKARHIADVSRVCRASAGIGLRVGDCPAGPLTAATCCLEAANGAGRATPVRWTYRDQCITIATSVTSVVA